MVRTIINEQRKTQKNTKINSRSRAILALIPCKMISQEIKQTYKTSKP
ncbi:hypothetical protein HanXRQr2_Chr06g0249211 [Helianthus annuus]|uniref:Uncharacterized protein n=1 Tax=Helianthus annuus TaxID=4232 RepID=A0A9K3IR20_HELAN|nr:hypothetical protein HanXRQr2_Chr06g0249211 [Helianthus annuus]KAJ0851176.1 hypothetical protein HanPSC8_Chr13g0589231 [Helianthus annuus]